MAKTVVKTHSGRIPPVSRLVRVCVGLIFLAIAGTVLNHRSFQTSGMSLVWLSNGFLIGLLLCAPKRQWPVFVAIGYLVDISLNLQQGNPLLEAGFLSIANMTEVLVAAALMYSTVAIDPDLTEPRQMASLLIYGVVLAPATASLMGAIYYRVVAGVSFSHSFRSWFAADAIGIAMTTPLYLSNHYGRKFSHRSRIEIAGLYLLLALVSTVVFRFTTYPMLWVVLLVLLLLGVRLGFTGSALGLLVVTFLGGLLTVGGYGPLRPGIHGSMATRVFIFQSFIGLTMLALYVTEVAMSNSRRVRSRLEASETRFRSLAEASRDVIILAELSGKRKYVSPAMTELLGWEQEELLDQHYAKITHPEDIPKLQQFLAELKEGGGLRPLAYRCRKKNGEYLWLEATARLLCNPHSQAPYGYVYVLRDITDRKAAEVQMQEAYQNVEQLAMMDGLTGVANRRLLDQTLAREWISSRRDRLPLSVMLIDIDCFKSFNDLYGHLEGDACLRLVAERMQMVLRRPLDLLARYGGEEFVAVLPNTPVEGTEGIAELLRKAVEDCAVPHAGSAHGIVTVSVGCATEVPSDRSSVTDLLNLADTALYRAKSGGRNRVHLTDSARMTIQ